MVKMGGERAEVSDGQWLRWGVNEQRLVKDSG